MRGVWRKAASALEQTRRNNKELNFLKFCQRRKQRFLDPFFFLIQDRANDMSEIAVVSKNNSVTKDMRMFDINKKEDIRLVYEFASIRYVNSSVDGECKFARFRKCMTVHQSLRFLSLPVCRNTVNFLIRFRA